MDNILSPNLHLKSALISELTIHLYNQKEKTEKAYNEGWFKFYFISICKNQIQSNRSSFHVNVRQSLDARHNKYFNKIQDSMNGFSIEEQEENELSENYNSALYIQAKKNLEIKCSWVENEMAKKHWEEGMTFREIQKYYDNALAYSRAFQLCKAWKEKLIQEINLLKSEQIKN